MQSLRNKALQALRSSEPFFKLDMVYATKGGFWTTLSFAIGAVCSLATMIAFGNLLPRETYGIYSYLISLGSSLTFLTLSGIGPAVTRAVARGIENIVPYALRMQLRYNLLAVATIGVAALYYSYKGNFTFGISLAFLATAYPIAEAFHIYVQVLTGKKRFDLLTKLTSAINITAAVATVITLLLTGNVLVIVLVFAFMSLVPKILAYRWVIRKLDKSLPRPEDLKEMRRTAFHITGAGIIGTVASYIDKIILFQVAGPVALAIYGFATAGPERLKSLLKGWISIALPRLTESSIHEIRSVFYKRIGLSVLIGTLLAVIYIIFSPPLFQWFLPKYLDSIFYSQIYALSLVAVPITIYTGSIFASQNMLRAIYAFNIGSQVARIVLFLIFGWLWQTWGLIVASLLSCLVNTIYTIMIWEFEIHRLIKKQST